MAAVIEHAKSVLDEHMARLAASRGAGLGRAPLAEAGL